MEQRQLRLGDILDDYCPRERRLTNHAVVAMIGEEVRQTRCLTCETEHVYKGARVPARRRRKDAPAALYAEVLAGMPEVDPAAARGQLARPVPAAAQAEADGGAREADPPPEAVPASPAVGEAAPTAEEGPAHRPLIRATLPRLEGQVPPVRPVPEFTIRQSGHGNGGSRGPQARAPHARQPGSRGPFAGGNKAGRGRGGRPSGGAHSGQRGADRFSPQAGQNRRPPFAPRGRKRSR